MNEAFDSVINSITDDDVLQKAKKLQNFNLIDVGTISDITEDGRCTVESFKFVNGMHITYTSLELIFPGGFGTLDLCGMFGIVLFPAPITDLSENTTAESRTYFSASGGKVIPVGLYNEDSLKSGFDVNGNFCLEGDKLNLKISGDSLNFDLAAVVGDTPLYGGSVNIFADKNGISISMANSAILYQTSNVDGSEILAHVANEKPFYFEKRVGETRWIGHNSYKKLQDRQFDLANFVKEDFLFVEYFITTERWIYVYKEDGSTYCAIGLDNTGVIDLTTEESVTVTTKKDVTVNRDGTKLEVKNGKVVVTGDLEVSGKTTITGMKTDVQNFFDGLTSALNSMFTLGSPATHNTDGGFKANIATLRSKL